MGYVTALVMVISVWVYAYNPMQTQASAQPVASTIQLHGLNVPARVVTIDNSNGFCTVEVLEGPLKGQSVIVHPEVQSCK